VHREATQFYIPILLAIMLAAALTYYWLEINRPSPVPEPATAPARWMNREARYTRFRGSNLP